MEFLIFMFGVVCGILGSIIWAYYESKNKGGVTHCVLKNTFSR